MNKKMKIKWTLLYSLDATVFSHSAWFWPGRRGSGRPGEGGAGTRCSASVFDYSSP